MSHPSIYLKIVLDSHTELSYTLRMEKQMNHQEAYFATHGYYDQMAKAPTNAEAVQHAMNKIERAIAVKKVVQIGKARYYEVNGQIVQFLGMVD